MSPFFYGMLACGVFCGMVAAQVGNDALDKATREMIEQREGKAKAAASPLLVPHQENARKLVDLTYNTWRVSHSNGGNEVAWQKNTTTSRIRKVRNLIISQRGQYPRDYFRSAEFMPMLENFTYIGSLAACQGNTLAATYLGKVQMGDGKPQDSAFVILLVNEAGRWKIDQTRFFNLSQLPEVKKRLQAKDIQVLKEQDGFHPYRELPDVPPLCGAPQLIGKIFVDCPGRNIDVTINGVSQHDFYDERRADVISGGLRRGQNVISYTIQDIDGKVDRPSMAIGLFVMPETKGNTPICVFDHILDATDTARGGTFTFYVTNTQIAAMNPQYKGSKPAAFHAVPLKPKQPAPQKTAESQSSGKSS